MTLYGNRVPRHFFLTSGVGESDLTVHAGSFHFALQEAGIESANHMTYSSILPARAEQIHQHDAPPIVHGEVMESIMAVHSCGYGDTATAGLAWGWLYSGQECTGGLVCEYSGTMGEHDAEMHLRAMLADLHVRSYPDDDLLSIHVEVRSVTPDAAHGTALVALCFVSHEWQEYPQN